QNGFTPICPNELPVPHGDEIADALNQQASFAKFRIGSKDAHPQNAIWVTEDTAHHPIASTIESSTSSHIDVYWPIHCVPGTKGFELIENLPHPSEYDFFIYKGIEPDMHPYGACYHDLQNRLSTGLIEFLKINAVDVVLVGGLAT